MRKFLRFVSDVGTSFKIDGYCIYPLHSYYNNCFIVIVAFDFHWDNVGRFEDRRIRNNSRT
jgi:hypothetical protein